MEQSFSSVPPWFVYILHCADNTFYTGITNNLDLRLATHNAGKASRYTRGRLPVKIVYTEQVENKSEALKREYQLKSFSRKMKNALIRKSIDS